MNFEWVARRGGTACRICTASSDGMVNWENGNLNGAGGFWKRDNALSLQAEKE